tara:strand:- start:720 stop:1244 length:525 start_codon:yes stop_codon:yes gene_type:complete
MKNSYLLLLMLILLSFIIPDKIMKKADKVIAKYYEIENFSKETIVVSEEINSITPSEFGKSNFFKIHSENNLIGYGYIGSALSKTSDFDYLVLFDSEMIIIKSKVLIYREEYGGEIGSKRWLKQFNGKSSTSDEVIYGDNIVPISGATISVRSMTRSINDLLKSIKTLKNKKVI